MQIALLKVQKCGISISFYALPALLYFCKIAISFVLEEFHLVCELWSNRHVENDRILILLLWKKCENKRYDCVLQRKLSIFMKTNFFIWSSLRCVFQGCCHTFVFLAHCTSCTWILLSLANLVTTWSGGGALHEHGALSTVFWARCSGAWCSGARLSTVYPEKCGTVLYLGTAVRWLWYATPWWQSDQWWCESP